jgi:hypothetical protein
MTQEERLSRYQQFKDFQKVIQLRGVGGRVFWNSKVQRFPEGNSYERGIVSGQ